ncbi:DUF222 domain-containing protein [Kribbella shirazensis]|uniref:DUF222 domain-containing protein n=1 Tax=Kribbella shirazensis TaxID=1105143 RepID=A0A7X5VBA4_9ACTN|nr:DUF222 domain-containing protein [Kribbella shirazensis]NIK57631.1 hypothetical protein [Kribbella shirazensis]
MFDNDLDDLSDRDLLAAAAEYAQDQERAAVGILRTALAFADRNAVIPGHKPLPGCERFVVYGGDGCPEIAEFAPVEFGAVLGMSSGAAASLIGEALALRHRLPRVWAAVLSGQAITWRARKIAEACLSLSLEAAAVVDRRVAGIVNTVTPRKLKTIVTAAIWEADPEQAQADAEAAARARGVFVAQSDDHGTKRIWVRAAAGDVIRFDATIDDLARALKILGDTDTLDQRRAKAIGWIADPAAAHQLLEVARYLARTQPSPPSNPASNPADNTDPADGADAADTATAGVNVAGAHASRRDATRAAAGGAATGGAATGGAATGGGAAGGAATGSATTGSTAWGDDVGTDDGQPAAPDCCDSVLEAEQVLPADDPAATAPIDTRHDMTDGDIDDLDREIGDEVDREIGGDLDGGDLDGDADGDTEVDVDGEDGFTRQALAGTLAARLAAIKRDAYSHGLGAGSGRRNRHTLYVHLTDKTLAAGNGVLRVEELGPLLARQLTELLGHDQVVVKPVIDLHDQVSVHSYEIPDRIRERVRLRHSVDMFPYGTAEATVSMDQDHIRPYDRTGPPGQAPQTSTDNLIPQSRLHHRAKTFGGWRNRRLPGGGIEWISPHGFRFIVDHAGTRPAASTSL